MRFDRWGWSLVVILALVAPGFATAQSATPDPLGEGLLAGPRWGRPPLSGDWGGARTWLAKRGLTLGLNAVNTLQAVVDGGVDEKTENGGSLYGGLLFDTGTAGLWPGGFLEVRGEWLYGDFVNAQSGSALGSNLLGLFPEPGDHTPVLSRLTFSQFLSPNFGIVLGRIDTLDSDGTHFSAGRGRTQFMNPGLTFAPTAALTTPYVVNGVALVARTPNPFYARKALLSFIFADPQVSPDESGFDDDFFDEQYYGFEWGFPTRFFELPGSQKIGFTHNTRERVELSDLSRAIFGFGTPDTDNVWTYTYNFHQYLSVEDGQDTQDQGFDPNTPLLQGFGVFGRASYSDSATNPTTAYFSLGLSGRGVIPTRDDDTFGLGVFYGHLSEDIDLRVVDFRDGYWGVELYYDLAATSWLHISPNLQVIRGARERVDTATILGLRVGIDL